MATTIPLVGLQYLPYRHTLYLNIKPPVCKAVFHLAISNMAQRHVAFCESHIALHERHDAFHVCHVASCYPFNIFRQ